MVKEKGFKKKNDKNNFEKKNDVVLFTLNVHSLGRIYRMTRKALTVITIKPTRCGRNMFF